MTPSNDIVEALRDPEVKRFFMQILASELGVERKYEQFIRFFEVRDQLEQALAMSHWKVTGDVEQNPQLVAAAAVQAGIWDPAGILRETADCVERAVAFVRRAQRPDGGWGFPFRDEANVWATAHAVMALTLAGELRRDVEDVRRPVRNGVGWLADGHRDEWLIDGATPAARKPVYEAAVAVRCLCRAGHDSGAATAAAALAKECICGLASAQNPDGGWDCEVPAAVGSDVGATSLVLEAMAAWNAHDFAAHREKGVQWLLHTQNDNGSWNHKTCTGDSRGKLEGSPSLNKTSDAIRGILAGRRSSTHREHEGNIKQAVDWLRQQEALLRAKNGTVIGWGFDDTTVVRYRGELVVCPRKLESTCLTLEALLQVEDVPLPVLTANAGLLIGAQHKQPGTKEDGLWIEADTFRTTLALLEYYGRIKESPIFQLSDLQAMATSEWDKSADADESKSTLMGRATP